MKDKYDKSLTEKGNFLISVNNAKHNIRHCLRPKFKANPLEIKKNANIQLDIKYLSWKSEIISQQNMPVMNKQVKY